jgi:hypothetical protein
MTAALIYVGLASVVVWLAVSLTRSQAHRRWRRVFVSVIAGICFAPSYLAGGHGYAVGPAWLAINQQTTMDGGSQQGLWSLGVAPIVGTAVLCFAAWEILRAVLRK